MRILMIAGCVLAAGTVLFAAGDEAALRSAMKEIGPTCSGLGKKIKAKDATASADAKKLVAAFGPVQKFWKAQKAEDGVTFSKTAAAEFKTISKLTAEGKWDEADASFKKATATCGGCHGAHREKGADGFKVK
jgi:cytochrome c556